MFNDIAAANAGAAVVVDRPTFIQSIRGMPQLVVRDKVYQLNRTKRNAEGKICKRYWNCKEKSICSATAITEHSLTPADDCTEASIENLVLKGDHYCLCNEIDVATIRARKSIIDLAVAQSLTPIEAHTQVSLGLPANLQIPSK